MSRPRISLAVLMVAIVIFAVALAAILSGSAVALKALYSATVLALLLSVIASRARPGAQGLFWFGFAVFGWGYFLISTDVSAEGGMLAKTYGGQLTVLSSRSALPTTELFESVWERYTKNPQSQGVISVDGDESAFDKAILAVHQSAETFVGIGHLLLVWVFGLVGGWTALLMAGGMARESAD